MKDQKPMIRILTSIFLTMSLLTTPVIAQGDPFTGNYEGKWEKDAEKHNPYIFAQVIPLGDSLYKILLMPELNKRAYFYLETQGRAKKDKLSFQKDEWEGQIKDDLLTGTVFKEVYGKKKDWQFKLKKTVRLSPTMGKKPPKGSVILFNGKNFKNWKAVHRKNDNKKVNWKIVEGAMQINIDQGVERHALETKRKFGDCELHIEWRVPYEPRRRGQNRGNSGVYINGYETQVLDSYGSPGNYDDAGAIYRVAPPKVNMSAPPLQWQTFDITFHNPKFNKKGKKIKNAEITVIHNGKLIHKNQEIPHMTVFHWHKRKDSEPNGPGPIYLQNHGHRVEFRNIWIKEL